MTGFNKVMRFCNTLQEYQSAKNQGTITDDLFVVILQDKLAKFKGQTFDWSENADLTALATKGELEALAEEIASNERVWAEALNDLNERINEIGTGGGGGTSDIVVDAALSTTSTNAIQNKAVANALNEKADASALASKQDTLVSGTNIKTVNGDSILGSGNISISVPTVDAALSSTSTNAVQNKVVKAAIDELQNKDTQIEANLTELSKEVVYGSPLDGVVFGNANDDKILRDIVKSVWLEVIDDSLDLNTEITFAVVRNDDSRNPSVVFQFTKGSKTVFTYTATEKLSATTHKISCVGYSDYANKANLHITLDFSLHAENIAFVSASYITLSNVSRQEFTSPIKVKEKITMIEEQIKEGQENVVSLFAYSNALRGCEFGKLAGDTTLKKCIKSIWLQIIDKSLELPSILKFSYFRNNTTNGFIVQIADEAGGRVMEEYVADQKSVGKHLGIASGKGNYEGRVSLHYELDLDDAEIRLNPGDMNTYLVTSALNTSRTSTLTTNEAISHLSGFKDKTIVCFGDSITSQLGEDGLRYTDYLQEFTSANIINVGVGGTQFRQRVAPVLSPSSNSEGWAGLDIINMVKAAANIQFDANNSYRNVVANAADYVNSMNLGRPKSATNTLLSINWQDVDAVIFFAGHNDWRNGETARGEHGSSDVNTTIGAINEIIRIMLTAYPHLKLYWCSPIVQWGETSASWSDDNWSDNIKYYGYTMKELSELIKSEVVFNHIPFCDLYNTLGWNKYNFSQYFVATDGTHPKKGYKMIAQKIASFLIANRTF